MGLPTAMYIGLSGMQANQARIDTIGNNIANVNTTAFKSTRMLFQTQLSRVMSLGTGPSDTSGGVNPRQVGLGTLVGATQRNHNPGSIETTGIASDLAIEGSGLFVLQTAGGRQVYTRDGSFSLDANNRLVSQDGHAVRGFGVDDNFNITPGVLTDLSVPLGTLSVARATANVTIDGDLSAEGTIATQGSLHRSINLVGGGGGAAAAGTSLTDLRAASAPTNPLFNDGDVITIRGLEKGDRTINSATFTVGTDGTTLGDFTDWLGGILGVQSGSGVPGQPGITIESGQIVINSNAGGPNGFSISNDNFLSTNPNTPLPLSFTEEQVADGSGVFTSFTVYDSLGTPVVVNATFTLEATPNSGPVWRYYLESPEQAGASRVLGTGTVQFDNQGNFLSASDNTFQLARDNSGAATPLEFTLDLTSVNGLSTQSSNVIAADQDGFPPGTLVTYGVGPDGVVSGAFSNGLTRTLGQVAIANFPNAPGLVAEADNLYSAGPNSGEPTITSPGQFGTGTILGGALELSNVDLSSEFIGLITTSTGFQAASRVISTSSDMLEQLLLVVR